MNWSHGQQEAIATAAAWLRIKYAPWFYLAGFAGTGKTTLAKHIASLQNGKVCYGAFTGKAAKVMRAHGCKNACTIHSLIYDVQVDPETGMIHQRLDRSALDGVSLVVIDEVSMVNDDLGKDLLSFGVPVLVLGDPFQLPPPDGQGFFTSGKPTVMLTEVHRQAKDSPIVRLATDIREGRWARRAGAEPGLTVTRRADLDQAAVTSADAVIVGRNATRQKYNARLRELAGFEGPDPQQGEKVICLRNDREKGISNGEVFRIDKVRRTSSRAGLGRMLRYDLKEPDNENRPPVKVQVWEHFFQGRAGELPFPARRGTQELDFAAAITCHKAQGSQYPSVCVFDESRFFKEHAANHLYTAITRASKQLTLVID